MNHRPAQLGRACAAAERYRKDSNTLQVLTAGQLSVAVAVHNDDVEGAHQGDPASFQVLCGREVEHESRWVAALVPHRVGDGIRAGQTASNMDVHEEYRVEEAGIGGVATQQAIFQARKCCLDDCKQSREDTQDLLYLEAEGTAVVEDMTDDDPILVEAAVGRDFRCKAMVLGATMTWLRLVVKIFV